MHKGGNGRERLFNLFYNIKDLLRDITPFQTNSKELKSMLTELKELVPRVKIDKEEQELIKKLEVEIQEALT